MRFAEALLLGLVQGLTEFVPVSSSAHLRIAGLVLPGVRDPGAAFTAIIQLGTEAAVLLYFRRDLLRLARALVLGLVGRPRRGGRPVVPRTDHDFRLAVLILLGSVPIVVLGLLLQTAIETGFRSLRVVAVNLVVFGLLLGLVDLLGKRRRSIADLTARDGLLMGLAQSLALVPGVSRSGGTIGAGLALGFTREAAARYSVLLALPAVWGSGLYELVRTVRDPGPQVFDGIETLAAAVVAFGVGLVVIAGLLRYLARGSFLPFVVYRVALGGVLLAALALGVIQP